MSTKINFYVRFMVQYALFTVVEIHFLYQKQKKVKSGWEFFAPSVV